ncbi:MAG: hypothetical protein LBP38_03680 [Desulfovibrio sp.]|nr:hypothetical protein [Desulfovibrio sp.]
MREAFRTAPARALSGVNEPGARARDRSAARTSRRDAAALAGACSFVAGTAVFGAFSS